MLVITGTLREAEVLAKAGLTVIPGGGDAAGLRAAIEARADQAAGILSFGFAGALSDSLRIGDWVIADRLTGTRETQCDPAWSAALLRNLPGARSGAIYADGRLISDVAQKRALGAHYGAIGVDMESHICAEFAAARSLPFAIARCISDEASRVLPPAIAVAMRPGGKVDGGAMLRSLATRPRQIGDFALAIRGFMRAMAALRSGAVQLAPHLMACGERSSERGRVLKG
ncbi:MAG: phosphorylase [Novosphingobium sp.]|nr:phosphorylase [Novosphingobium sp.]